MTYLSRYQKGEHERVWKELVALGNRVRKEPVYMVSRFTSHRFRFTM